MAPDPKKAQRVLKKRRKELEQVSALSAESRETVVLDQSSVGRLSRIDSLQQQAMAKATEQKRIAELARIDAALQRIAQDEDEYGYCTGCGEEIAAKRLAIDPSATLCIKCAK